MQYAGFPTEAALTAGVMRRRLAGWLIDACLLVVIVAALKSAFWVLGVVTFGLGSFLNDGLWVVPIAYAFAFAASPANATPGQAAMGLRIVRDEDLGPPRLVQAAGYAILYSVTMALGVVWLLAACFTRRGRCLHDVFSGVAVLREDALPPVPVLDGMSAWWAAR